MDPSRTAKWQQLVDFSNKMLAQAREGEWDLLDRMAGERQAALEQFFAEPVSAEESAAVEAGIHTINRIDSEITALANNAYGLVSEEHELLKKRQQASRAYTDPGFHSR